MTLWLLLALAFVVQEPISSSGILLEAYQAHYNIWLIHLLFSAATIFEIAVGYWLGSFFYKRSDRIRFAAYLKRKFESLSVFMGKKGKALTIIIFVPILFPLSALILPWFEMSFMECLVYTFIGEWIFWYGYEWLLVLGVKSFAQDSHFALYAVLAVSLITSVILRIVFKKMGKKR